MAYSADPYGATQDVTDGIESGVLFEFVRLLLSSDRQPSHEF